MRALGCMLLVLLLIGCGQVKTETSNQVQESENSLSSGVEQDSVYSIFNTGTLEDFTANFNN
jgi:hypothetical protein